MTGVATILQSNKDALATYKKIIGDFEAGYFALKVVLNKIFRQAVDSTLVAHITVNSSLR